MPTLEQKRRDVANQILVDYDNLRSVDETTPWEWDHPKGVVSRTLFIDNVEKPRAARIEGGMRVVFESGSARPVEAVATANGIPFGTVDLEAVMAEFAGAGDDFFAVEDSVPASAPKPSPVSRADAVVEIPAVKLRVVASGPAEDEAPESRAEPEAAGVRFDPGTDEDPLTAKRREVGEIVFEGFAFGARVEHASGWDWSVPGDEISRTVFLENGSGSGPGLEAMLSVRFEADGARPIEAYAIVGEDLVEGFDVARAIGTVEERDPYFFDGAAAPRI